VEINSLSSFSRDGFKIPFWWDKLMADSSFVNRIQCRWRNLRHNQFTIDRLLAYIDSVANVLDESQARNFERWPILDTYIWPNRVWLGTYPNEVAYLKAWLEARMIWIDANLPGKCLSTVSGHNEDFPAEFRLNQNYPNPFNPRTVISWQLPVGSMVELSVYNLLGEKIAVLVTGRQPAGYYETEWDASGFASGVYLYRLTTDHALSKTRKLVLIK
jgi:hypothetical protein